MLVPDIDTDMRAQYSHKMSTITTLLHVPAIYRLSEGDVSTEVHQ
jgi:hypothetical protein